MWNITQYCKISSKCCTILHKTYKDISLVFQVLHSLLQCAHVSQYCAVHCTAPALTSLQMKLSLRPGAAPAPLHLGNRDHDSFRALVPSDSRTCHGGQHQAPAVSPAPGTARSRARDWAVPAAGGSSRLRTCQWMDSVQPCQARSHGIVNPRFKSLSKNLSNSPGGRLTAIHSDSARSQQGPVTADPVPADSY